MGKMSILLLTVILLFALVGQGAAWTTRSEAKKAATAICKILFNLQFLLTSIAGGLGIVVITLQGIKWIGSAEDPGARKQAKQGIIHAVVGLIIVILAVFIVGLVFTAGTCGIQSVI